MIDIYLALAKICFTVAQVQQCHPALVGPSTPVGIFVAAPRIVYQDGYGGDVIQFHETEKAIFAIHRVWEGSPSERRRARLSSRNPKDRSTITNGCVNVTEDVYATLYDCCSREKITIHR